MTSFDFQQFYPLGPNSSSPCPQSSVLRSENIAFLLQKCQKKSFCSKKLDLRHFGREYRKNLNIRTLRTKFRIKSAGEDSPQLVTSRFSQSSCSRKNCKTPLNMNNCPPTSTFGMASKNSNSQVSNPENIFLDVLASLSRSYF